MNFNAQCVCGVWPTQKTLILHTKVGKKVYHRIMKIKQEKKYSKFAGDLNEPKSQCHFILFPFRSNPNELSTCNALDTLTNICIKTRIPTIIVKMKKKLPCLFFCHYISRFISICLLLLFSFVPLWKKICKGTRRRR